MAKSKKPIKVEFTDHESAPFVKKAGMKSDDGKLRFDLVPPLALKVLAQVFTMGSKKYDDNSWQNLENFEQRYLAALHRHLNAHQLGEIKDPESGLYHLDHAMWNILALRWKLEQGPTLLSSRSGVREEVK